MYIVHKVHLVMRAISAGLDDLRHSKMTHDLDLDAILHSLLNLSDPTMCLRCSIRRVINTTLHHLKGDMVNDVLSEYLEFSLRFHHEIIYLILYQF